jgi:hypothetical protein
MVLAALVATLLLAPSAPASTVGVLDDPDAIAVALAGPDAIVQRQTRNTFELVAVPRGGGRPQSVLTLKPVEYTLDEPYRLAASASRVALIAEMLGRDDETTEWRVYSGPPRGPYTVIRSVPVREGWVPAVVSVDGDRVLIVEGRQEPDGPIRAFLWDPVSGLVPLPWANAASVPFAIAGRYAAVLGAAPERAAVRDLATGAEVARIPLAKRVEGPSLAVTPDGRLALANPAEGISIVAPGGAARRLGGTKGLRNVHLAGETVTAVDRRGRAVVVATGGTLGALGLPTTVFTHAAGDSAGYAWIANGCVWHAAIPITAGRKAGPCPTTEIGLYGIDASKLNGRTLLVRVRCIAAPRDVCRGTVLGRDSFSTTPKAIVGRGRFAVRVGGWRRVKMTMTAATVKRWREKKFGSLLLGARIPNGRLGEPGEGNSELSVQGLE